MQWKFEREEFIYYQKDSARALNASYSEALNQLSVVFEGGKIQNFRVFFSPKVHRPMKAKLLSVINSRRQLENELFMMKGSLQGELLHFRAYTDMILPMGNLKPYAKWEITSSAHQNQRYAMLTAISQS